MRRRDREPPYGPERVIKTAILFTLSGLLLVGMALHNRAGRGSQEIPPTPTIEPLKTPTLEPTRVVLATPEAIARRIIINQQ